MIFQTVVGKSKYTHLVPRNEWCKERRREKEWNSRDNTT